MSQTKNKMPQLDINQLQKMLLQKSLYEFVKYFWPTFEGVKLKDLWLMEYQAECFQYTVRGFLPDWITDDWIDNYDYEILKEETGGECPVRDKNVNNHDWNMPPRHSKSTTHNVVGPVWLNTIQAVEVASVSHIQDLATDFNAKRQKIMKSPSFKKLFPEIWTVKDSAKELSLNNGGKMYSVGMTNFTGFGADIIINDDIVSSEHAKKDKEILENAKSYWRNTMPTRRNQGDDSVIWNIMQRLSSGDISGMIEDDEHLSNMYSKTVVKAIATEDKTIIYPCSGKIKVLREGDYLWPDRFGDYSGTKGLVGNTTFETQYQQNALNSELTYIKKHMIKYITYDEFYAEFIQNDARHYGSFDFPIKGKDTSDHLGYVEAYNHKARTAIVDGMDERMGYKEQKEFCINLNMSNPDIIQIYEDKANGSVLVQDLENEVPGIVEFEPGTNDKETRVDIASDYMKNVVFVKDQDGAVPKDIQHLIDMLIRFPFIRYDDIVDAFSQLLLYIYTDKLLKVFGLSFDHHNVIKSYDTTRKMPVDLVINKRGNKWKLLEIAHDYRNDAFIVLKEYLFIGKTSEIVEKVREIRKGKRMTYEAGNEVYNLMMGKMVIEPNYTTIDETLTSMLNGLVTNNILIMNTCYNTITDIETLRWSKESIKNREPKANTSNDGFAGCIRVIINANKGKNATFR